MYVHSTSSCIRIARISHGTEFNDEITIERFTNKKKSFNEEKSVYSQVIHTYVELGSFLRYLIEKRKKQHTKNQKVQFISFPERDGFIPIFCRLSLSFVLSLFFTPNLFDKSEVCADRRNVWNFELWGTLQDNSYKFRLLAEILSTDL